MNTSITDLVAAIATQNPWDLPVPHTLGAYQTYLETKKNKMLTTPDNTKLILAGVQACSLASQVLRLTWKEPLSADARVTISLAHTVIESWGITLEQEELPEPPQQADPVPVATTDVLVWPPVDRLGRPLSTTLPEVYRENYYHLHEKVLVDSPTDARFGSQILPEHQLVLKSWYWSEEALQWRMKFTFGNHVFWLNHCQVKPGDEIPKVIDAATQARSNDP